MRSVNRLAALTGIISVCLSSWAYAQNVSCTCRFQGEDYGVGESICLKSSGGLKMATCSMVLNNTSWKISNAPCPVTELDEETLEKLNSYPSDPTLRTDDSPIVSIERG